MWVTQITFGYGMIKVKPNSKLITIYKRIADFQFMPGAGEAIVPDDCEFVISKNTGVVRGIVRNSKILATIRASDMRFILHCEGARLLKERFSFPSLRVVVIDEVSKEIGEGGNVFAKHVLDIDRDLRPWDEVVVVNERDELLSVGKLVLSPLEALYFTRGVAVISRDGCWKYSKGEEEE